MDNSCIKHCVGVHTEQTYLLPLPTVKGTDKGQLCVAKSLVPIVISVAPSFCSEEPSPLEEAESPRSLETERTGRAGGRRKC